jgi:hypothetical protein
MPGIPLSTDQLLDALRSPGVATARELGAALGNRQPTISRGLATAETTVARIGPARNMRYAATRKLRELGDRWPLYRVDDKGRPQRLAS